MKLMSKLSRHLNTSNLSVARQAKIKLPRIHLPAFDRNSLSWLQFWDLFKATCNAPMFLALKSLLFGSSTSWRSSVFMARAREPYLVHTLCTSSTYNATLSFHLCRACNAGYI